MVAYEEPQPAVVASDCTCTPVVAVESASVAAAAVVAIVVAAAAAALDFAGA